jgi:hypothetical protein
MCQMNLFDILPVPSIVSVLLVYVRDMGSADTQVFIIHKIPSCVHIWNKEHKLIEKKVIIWRVFGK